MTLIKKHDLPGYFAGRRLKSSMLHLVARTTPEATGSGAVQAARETNTAEFKQDFIEDHSVSSRHRPSATVSGSASEPHDRAVAGRARE